MDTRASAAMPWIGWLPCKREDLGLEKDPTHSLINKDHICRSHASLDFIEGGNATSHLGDAVADYPAGFQSQEHGKQLDLICILQLGFTYICCDFYTHQRVYFTSLLNPQTVNLSVPYFWHVIPHAKCRASTFGWTKAKNYTRVGPNWNEMTLKSKSSAKSFTAAL